LPPIQRRYALPRNESFDKLRVSCKSCRRVGPHADCEHPLNFVAIPPNNVACGWLTRRPLGSAGGER